MHLSTYCSFRMEIEANRVISMRRALSPPVTRFTGTGEQPDVNFATADASAVRRHAISRNVDIVILINFTLFFLIINRPWLYRAHYAFSSVCGTRSSERIMRYDVYVRMLCMCICVMCVCT